MSRGCSLGCCSTTVNKRAMIADITPASFSSLSLLITFSMVGGMMFGFDSYMVLRVANAFFLTTLLLLWIWVKIGSRTSRPSSMVHVFPKQLSNKETSAGLLVLIP